MIETDASDSAIGSSLSQEGKPVAFFSRILQISERKHSTVEREALAIVESCIKWRHILHSVPGFTIVTDQKVVSFMFDQTHTSKIKNEKITRWRIALSDFKFNISYRPGADNIAADALSRCATIFNSSSLHTIHSRLCHPGITRLFHYCKKKNLPYSTDEIRRMINSCQTCREVKPRFFKPDKGTLISSIKPWQRLSVDFVGPLESVSQNKYLLVIVDEFSRFPFAIPCSDMSARTVIIELNKLFSIFGTPHAIHSDRGAQFESEELRNFLLNNNIVKTRTTPYRPQGNGQCERSNGTILKIINLALRERKLHKSNWEAVLNQALSSIRSLLSTATNETPHDRFFNFDRSSIIGTDLPSFLQSPGSEILIKNFTRQKNDPIVNKVKLIETISPYFARVQHQSGKIDTVSTRHLAPSAETMDGKIQEDTSNKEQPIQTPADDEVANPDDNKVLNLPIDTGPQEEVAVPSEAEEIRQFTRYGRNIKPPERFRL